MKHDELEDYMLPNILENNWSIYKQEIIEFFIKNKSEFIFGQKRDNCGVIAAGFYLFMKEKGLELTRVQGDFKTDVGSFKKLDFFKEELTEMKNVGLDPNKLEDRMKFVDKFNLKERQKRIPHYWNIDENGIIIDLSGYSQFIKTGLAKDLNINRYEQQIIKNEKKLVIK